MPDVITEARGVLLKAAEDTRTKIFGFDKVLHAVSDALGELQRRQDATQAQVERGRPAAHAPTCECKPCALARMVTISRGAQQ